jgi:uncharacterized secreted protein with C-terminal beta-propeller domain
MAADDPSPHYALDATLTITDRAAPHMIAASVATPAAASVAISSADATDSGWERFASQADVEAWLIETAIAQYGHLFGQQYGSWYSYPYLYVRAVDNLGITNFTTNLASVSADHSTTNVQVAGVDEADLIETDGSYLYIISGEDLVIVQAGIGDDLRVLSRIHIGGRPVGMFLDGDRLAIVSENSRFNDWSTSFARLAVSDMMYIYESTPPKTTVTILDIADRAAPTLVQKTEMDGHLVASRVVDGELRLVLNNGLRLPPPVSKPVESQTATTPKVYPTELQPDLRFSLIADYMWWPDQGGQEYVYETQEEYLARVRETILESVIPRIRSLAVDGEVISENPLFNATDLYKPVSHLDQSITTIATFDLTSNDPGPAATTSVMTYGSLQVHATTDSIYLFSQKPFDWNPTDSIDYTPRTVVWKFEMAGGNDGPQLVAKGDFTGSVLNQFAIDERDGYLRVVTDNSWTSGHALHVLQQDGDRLEVVGSIGGIAPTEHLYSVRFLEDRAFFVTFRKVDPLFAVDLSDPTDPQLLGELHIPGYSDYLQPIDDTHLLAIGRGADESTGLFQELQVSIFDVSDLATPQLLHRYSFDGGRSTATPVTGDRWTRGDGDHHAVSYFADDDLLAFPIFTEGDWMAEGGGLFSNGEGGLQVFNIDIATGFTPLTVIEHDTLVERSVRIGDHLYAISSGAVTVHELDDPTLQLGEVSIASSDTPLTELVAYPWQLTFATAFAELASELSTTQLDSERASEPDSALPIPWATIDATKFRPTQRRFSANPTTAAQMPRLDATLLNLLATHNAARERSSDLDTFGLSENDPCDRPDEIASNLESLLKLSDGKND